MKDFVIEKIEAAMTSVDLDDFSALVSISLQIFLDMFEEYEDFAPANRNIHFMVTLCVYKICKSLKDVNMVIRESYIAFMAIFSFTA